MTLEEEMVAIAAKSRSFRMRVDAFLKEILEFTAECEAFAARIIRERPEHASEINLALDEMRAQTAKLTGSLQ